MQVPTERRNITYQRSAAQANRAICAAWLDWLAKRGRTAVTVYQYAQKLDLWLDYLGPRPLADVTVADLEDYLDRPRVGRAHGGEGADATKAKDLTVLRGLWRWAVTRGHLAHDPTADLTPPKVRNSNPRAIAPELWAKVWTSDLEPAERVVLGLGYYVGLRREEICRLTAAHVDVASGRLINFKRKGDGNDKVTGVVPYLSCVRLVAERRPELIGVPEYFLGPLEAAVAAADPWVLPWGPVRHHGAERRPEGVLWPRGMTSPDQINRRLGRRLAALGLPGAFTPHALRHSFVTNLLEMGVDLVVVSRLANHSSVAITMRYARVAEDPLARFLGGGTTLKAATRRDSMA